MSWLSFGISLLLIFAMGVAIQRGNTCTVVAIDDLVHRRSPDRVLAISYCWLVVAGGLTLLNLAAGIRPGAHLFPVTVWSAIGGAVLGIGAVINGACTTGTIARIGSGEYAFGLTLAGFFLGCLTAPHLFGPAVTTHVAATPTVTSLDFPILSLLGLAVVAAVTVRRLVSGTHESVRDFLRSAWDPRTATLIIAILFVTLVQISGPWAYTEWLNDVSRGMTAESWSRLAFLVVLVLGAVVGGRSLRGQRLIGPLAPRALRCTVGGFVMGSGFAAAPGAFDGLTLLAQPLLLPYSWVVMGAAYAAILAGILYLRSAFGARIRARRG